MKSILSTILCAFLIGCVDSNASCRSNKAPIKVAVIDTGFGFQDRGHSAKLCKYGHKDFSTDRQFSSAYSTTIPVPVDNNGHGTNIVGIIDHYASEANVNYCIVVIKYYAEFQTGEQNLSATVEAIKYATNIGVDFINYSGGGPEADLGERLAIIKFLNKGGIFVAAAGNENQSLDIQENAYYPAMDDPRIVVVGNSNGYGMKSEQSNFGRPVNRWEIGEKVTAFGITETGTSQAAAVATGKIVSQSKNKCDIGN